MYSIVSVEVAVLDTVGVEVDVNEGGSDLAKSRGISGAALILAKNNDDHINRLGKIVALNNIDEYSLWNDLSVFFYNQRVSDAYCERPPYVEFAHRYKIRFWSMDHQFKDTDQEHRDDVGSGQRGFEEQCDEWKSRVEYVHWGAVY